MCVFFFNDTATTEIYTLSLHDALPISELAGLEVTTCLRDGELEIVTRFEPDAQPAYDRLSALLTTEYGDTLYSTDRKSTRLNSSHANISYAVFCLKKKKNYLTLLREQS